MFIMCLINGFSQRNAPNDARCPPYDARDASRVRVNRIGIVLFVNVLWSMIIALKISFPVVFNL